MRSVYLIVTSENKFFGTTASPDEKYEYRYSITHPRAAELAPFLCEINITNETTNQSVLQTEVYGETDLQALFCAVQIVIKITGWDGIINSGVV